MLGPGLGRGDARTALVRAVLAQEPLAQLDYVSVADAEILAELETIVERPALVSLAVRFGDTRLIDNILLGPQF